MTRVLSFVEKIEHPEKSKHDLVFDDAINEFFHEMNDEERVARIKEMIDKMGLFWNYSFHNQFLILSQAPDSTRVASFKTWVKLKRFVKKGEKGIVIWVPVPYKCKAKDKHIKLGMAEQDSKTGEWFLKKLSFKTGHVFDVSQTDGESLDGYSPEAIGDAKRTTAILDACASKNHIEVESIELLKSAGSWGRSLGGKIQLDSSLNDKRKCAVYAHELAHELLHQTKQDFDETSLERLALSRRAKEFEAEVTAYIVCRQLGMKISSSTSYVLMWADADPKFVKTELFKSMERIKKTARNMLGDKWGKNPTEDSD